MSGAVREYTEYFDLELPTFDFPGWHVYYDRNLKTIDAILYLMTGSDSLKGVWKNSRAYLVGDLVVDVEVAFAFECFVAHTSAPAPALFADDRNAHPTYWHSVDFIHALSGTSNTSVTIGLGNKTFQTQTGRIFNEGSKIIINYGSDPVNTYMWGSVVSYSGSTLVVDVDVVGGSGTYADWLITVSGERGPVGPQGIQGIQGEIGFIGPDGVQGPKGDQGIIEEPPATGAVYGRSLPVGEVEGDWVTVSATSAATLPVVPAGDIASTNVQDALNELDTEKVALTGDTMTGPLILPGDPVAELEAATKRYADTASGDKVFRTGDVMTGMLTVPKLTHNHPTQTLVDFNIGGVVQWTIAANGTDWRLNKGGGAPGTPIMVSMTDGFVTANYGLHVGGGGANINGNTKIAGDVTAYRPGSPTTGVYYFGLNQLDKYLYFNGTNFSLSGGSLLCGAISTQGNSIACGAITCSTLNTQNNTLSCGNLASGGTITAPVIVAGNGDGLQISTPGNARISYHMHGIRIWSAGVVGDGAWSIYDESAGGHRRFYIATDGNAAFTGSLWAASFNGNLNGKASSAGYADSAGSFGSNNIENIYYIDLKYPGHEGEDFDGRIIASADHNLHISAAWGAIFIDGRAIIADVVDGKAYRQRSGLNGTYQDGYFNIWNAGPAFHFYSGDTDYGAIYMASDYRAKQNVANLPSMWDNVKALRPVSFEYKDFEAIKADGIERWGFIAHELQESLLPSAANGVKDEENVVQCPVDITIVAVLTKALQEAMERIEALEVALAIRK